MKNGAPRAPFLLRVLLQTGCLEARRLGLVERDLDARGLRVVHALVIDEEAVVVDDRDRHAPAVLLRLRGRAGRDFLGELQPDVLAVGRAFLRRGARGEQGEYQTQYEFAYGHFLL